ncbi:putative Galactose-binding-like domain superfamily [Dioscorea sansibarensis]
MKNTELKDPHAIPEWEISGYVEYVELGQKQDDILLIIPEGSRAVRLANGASIKQSLKVTKGQHYSITFSAARSCAQNEQLNVSVMPHSDVISTQTLYSSTGWDPYAWSFKAEFEDVDVRIHNTDFGNHEDAACGLVIDSVAMKTLVPPKRTNKNFLKNGDFEEGPYIMPNTSLGVLISNAHLSPLLGWVVESAKVVKYLDSDHYSVPSGNHAVELVAGLESAVAQVVRTVRGRVYVLEFSVGDAGNACEGTMLVDVYAGAETLRVEFGSKGEGGSKRAVLRLTAVAKRTRVVFRSSAYHMRSDDLSTLCGPVIDDVTLVSVRGARRLGL